MNLADLLPKTNRGSLQLQWKRCGKKGCRCCHGTMHGPYLALYWRAEGRQKKRYIRLEELPDVLEILDARAARLLALQEIHHQAEGIRDECT